MAKPFLFAKVRLPFQNSILQFRIYWSKHGILCTNNYVWIVVQFWIAGKRVLKPSKVTKEMDADRVSASKCLVLVWFEFFFILGTWRVPFNMNHKRLVAWNYYLKFHERTKTQTTQTKPLNVEQKLWQMWLILFGP